MELFHDAGDGGLLISRVNSPSGGKSVAVPSRAGVLLVKAFLLCNIHRSLNSWIFLLSCLQ